MCRRPTLGIVKWMSINKSEQQEDGCLLTLACGCGCRHTALRCAAAETVLGSGGKMKECICSCTACGTAAQRTFRRSRLGDSRRRGCRLRGSWCSSCLDRCGCRGRRGSWCGSCLDRRGCRGRRGSWCYRGRRSRGGRGGCLQWFLDSRGCHHCSRLRGLHRCSRLDSHSLNGHRLRCSFWCCHDRFHGRSLHHWRLCEQGAASSRSPRQSAGGAVAATLGAVRPDTITLNATDAPVRVGMAQAGQAGGLFGVVRASDR
jgi:hypothetical protein